ncbi:MAG: elongation factor G [Dehalococcoidia bacterium]|nr:elongation factor G [Dehalococcoidia bacterium]
MQQVARDRVRNVALVGHSKSGKTSLAEAMLLASGAISRLGRVEDGATVSDFDEEEHRHGHSIGASLLTLDWDGHRLHVLDTPGYADFEGEVVSAAAAADIAVVTVDAVAGIEGGTEAAWERLEQAGVRTRIFAITRTDREHADVQGVLEALRQRFGPRVVLAATLGQGERTRSLLDASDPALAAVREQLVEALAETDDALLERYLEGEDIAEADLRAALCSAVRTGQVFPAYPVCGLSGVGVSELLEALCEQGPPPASDEDTRAPALLQVVKTSSDPFVGHLSYVRVLRGTLTSGDRLHNQRSQADERAAHLFAMRGKEQVEVPALAAGDLGAIPRLSSTATGDILAAAGGLAEAAASVPALDFPAPTYRSALRPRSRDDLDRMSQALARMLEQDPTLAMERGVGGEIVLLTMGDVQASIAASRLQQEYGVAVDVEEPLVAYCETIRASVEAEYRHKKQTGGRGQFAHVVIRVEPLERDAGFEFAEHVTGGRVPRQYIPAVEHGVTEALAEGPLTRSRLVDLKVTLLDGSSHAVDSSEFAFKIAAAQALHQAVLEARPVLLEPVMRLHVEVPSDLVGDIANELNGRRGSVLSFDAGERVTSVEAFAPLAEVQRLAPQLRSLTHGRGRFRLEFDHLAEVPPQVQERILAKRQLAATPGA